MSNSKKESRDVRVRNYSFSNHQGSNPSASELDRPPREPLRETEAIRNFSPSRYQSNSKLKMPPFTLPPQPTAEELYSLHQQDEIRKLQEVIYYLTGDKDILKQECTSLNMQVASLSSSFAKERQSYEAEMRKLKEMIKDKESEVGSIGKAARKEKEIYEQENERMKAQLKLLIQKKNDEIYAISREKETQNQQIRRTLENVIEELKVQHAKELVEKDGSKLSIQEEISSLKDRNQRLEEQLTSNEQRHEQQKLKLVESHELFISDLKQNYHQTKMQLIQASKDQVAALQRNSEIQREVFLLEINNLKNSLAVYQRENEELQKILFDANRDHEVDTERLTTLIQELEGKLAHIHQQKEKELQFLKVKVAHLHSLDLQSASQLYSTKISHQLERFAILEAENKRLKDKLQEMHTKNKNLILQLAKRGSLYQEQLANLKVSHSKQLQTLNSKAQAEKVEIHNQNKQSIRESQNKSEKIRFQTQQLRKLRKLLDNKTKEVDQIENEMAKIKTEINQQRQRAENEQNSRQRQWHQERQKLKQEISAKSKEIQRLNNLLVDKANQESNYDYTPLENQIKDLRQQLKSKSEEGKSWRAKAEDLKKRVEELTLQQQSLKDQIEQDSSQLRAHWQEKAREKANDTENFYQRKIEILIFDKEQLKSQNDEFQRKIHQLTQKCEELDNSLQDLLSTYKNRSQLQAKIISLGLDINLIKNKHQLFEY